MAHKPYTRPWCAVKGAASWTFKTREAAEAKARRVSQGEQVDIHELVYGPEPGRLRWVWRSSTCVVLSKGEAA